MSNDEDEILPILDLSGFPVVVPPGEIYRMLDAQNAALQKLLGLPKLTKDFVWFICRWLATKRRALFNAVCISSSRSATRNCGKRCMPSWPRCTARWRICSAGSKAGIKE
jgi:hypothetical protein